MDRAGSPDGVSGCEEQPECYRAVSTTLIRQHGQRVCCIFCQKETTEGEAVTLQVRNNFFRSLSRLQRRCFGNLDSFSLVWLHYVLSCPIPFSKPLTFFCRFESSSHAISMSAYLREQRRELYSKSGELQGEKSQKREKWLTLKQLNGISDVVWSMEILADLACKYSTRLTRQGKKNKVGRGGGVGLTERWSRSKNGITRVP